MNGTQRKAAKVVGFCYLFAMAAGVFGESYVRGRLIVPHSAVETARNIMANEGLFRLGLASELLSFISDITMITALFVILEGTNRSFALLATFFRLVASAVCVVMTLTSFDALRVLSGADYLNAFSSDQLAVLGRLAIGAHGAAFNVAFIFLGLGSTVFAWLWLKSGYIPKALAWLGIVGSFLLAAGCFAIVVAPRLQDVLGLTFMMPLGIFEVTMGFWLLIKNYREV